MPVFLSVKLWVHAFIYLETSMFVTMQICVYFVYIYRGMFVWSRPGWGSGGLIATCDSWRRLLQWAAVRGRFPMESPWPHSLSGTVSENYSWAEKTSTTIIQLFTANLISLWKKKRFSLMFIFILATTINTIQAIQFYSPHSFSCIVMSAIYNNNTVFY